LDQIELELLSIARSVGVDLKQEEWKNAEDSPPFYKNNTLRKLSSRDPSHQYLLFDKYFITE
jgi:hypothetical protein